MKLKLSSGTQCKLILKRCVLKMQARTKTIFTQTGTFVHYVITSTLYSRFYSAW